MTASTPTIPESGLTGLSAEAYPPTYRVVRHVLSFLKWRFSQLPPGAYQWKPETEDSPDQTGSEVFIAADTPIKPEVVGKRPAVTVLRSQGTFQGVGLGDLAFVDLATGSQVRMDLFPTNVMVNVLSQLPVEAERLAWFCAEQIWTFREEIIKTEHCILNIGGRASISAPSPAGSLVESTDFEWCAVVVALPCYLQHSTTKVPTNRRTIKGIKVSGTAPTPVAKTKPAVMLQGTAAGQPKATVPSPTVQFSSTAGLPQQGDYEAESNQSLTVEIKTQ